MSKEAIKHYEAALKEAFPRGATGEVFHHWNEARYLIATEALDKKAENARELGLDYEPARDSGIVTAGGADPRTQRTWVGLTDEERDEICLGDESIARSIEAKLREKNGGNHGS